MILVNYLAAGALFCIGLYAVLSRRNLIKIVMGLSLITLGFYYLFWWFFVNREMRRAA